MAGIRKKGDGYHCTFRFQGRRVPHSQPLLLILLRRRRPPSRQDAMRHMITDELWAVLGPAVKQAKRNRCGQKPHLPDRLFFEALLYLAPHWHPLARPAGRLRRLGRGLQPLPPLDLLGEPAAAVRTPDRRPPARRGSPGADRQYDRPCPRACRRGPAKKRGAEAQGLGRSRGGFTSKVIVTATDEDTAVVVDVVPGQANDYRGFRHAVGSSGRPDRRARASMPTICGMPAAPVRSASSD